MGSVVHLARERELRETDARFRELLQRHPEIVARTQAAISAHTPDLEERTMPRDDVAVYLPRPLVAQADELVPLAREHRDLPELAAATRITRAAVIRVALAMGLRRLRRELGAPDASD